MQETKYSTLPEEMIEELETRLEEPLKSHYDKLGPGQAFISFIGYMNPASSSIPFKRPPDKLWIPEQNIRVEALQPNKPGLTGWAAELNEVKLWPTDTESSERYAKTDERVKTEIVGPIHYKGKVTGVVLFDCITDGRIYGEADKIFFTELLHKIDLVIREIERRKEEPYVAEQLRAIANHCYSETISARGYIAVKRWDGLLEYFEVGDKKELFLELSPQEGLCGKVFRTGKLENPKDPLEDGNYIPSDDKIESEIVYPICYGADTIGVINLESYLPNAYGGKEEKLLEEEAKKAADYAMFYRKPPDPNFGFAISDLFQSSLSVRPPSSFEDLEKVILRTLERWAMGLLKGKRCEDWLSKKSPPPAVLENVSWDDAKGDIVPLSNSPNSVVYAPVLLQGDPIFIVAIELEGQSGPHDLRTLKALCRIASEAYRRAKYEFRVKKFIDLIDLLIFKPDNEAVIDRAVCAIPFILQSDHCTLFYPLNYDGSILFVPGPSTAENIHVKGYHPGYLPKMSEGLTGYVAETGKELRIRNVRDRKELAGINENLVWQSRISEEVEWECRSLLAFPVMTREHEVIGVLRTHRDSKSRRSGFTDDNVAMFKAIAHLLGEPLSVFLEKKIFAKSDKVLL